MPLPPISRPVLWFFRRIVRGYFRRHFRAVRLARAANVAALEAPRLILYSNHSSWWDPMVLVLLAHRLMPLRHHYAPIEATMLERYSLFKRLGMFGVEIETRRGAAQFLRTGHAILDAGGVLWVTPQGRFADNRERPLDFKPGLAALVSKARAGCTLVPLAIEYVFWNERLPETLLHLGDPVHAHGQSTAELQEELQAALLKTMEALKSDAMARNSDAFTLLQHGTVGTGGFYEFGQRALAALRRRPFQPEHSAPPPVHRSEPG